MQSEVVQLIDKCIKETWLYDISRDYHNFFLLKEDTLKNAFYYHLRRRLGDGFFEQNHLRIFTEYQYGSERIDLVIAQLNEKSEEGGHLQNKVNNLVAAIEMKYKGSTSDIPFLQDVQKVLRFIKEDPAGSCQVYLAFIQEVEFYDWTVEHSWLSIREQKQTRGRLTELTHFWGSEIDKPRWNVRSYNGLNSALNTAPSLMAIVK
ncbi:hypothetical protein [Aneurinibacillus sp. REN35]|uniref:hypothetical protein n=1 Tax=Aneurinibacillus sp. REN35 TaxID=3237286 RepID=UPI0035271752